MNTVMIKFTNSFLCNTVTAFYRDQQLCNFSKKVMISDNKARSIVDKAAASMHKSPVFVNMKDCLLNSFKCMLFECGHPIWQVFPFNHIF